MFVGLHAVRYNLKKYRNAMCILVWAGAMSSIPLEQHSPVPPIAICTERLIKHVMPFALSCIMWQNILS